MAEQAAVGPRRAAVCLFCAISAARDRLSVFPPSFKETPNAELGEGKDTPRLRATRSDVNRDFIHTFLSTL